MEEYDVIIVGASFAGLAVANQLKGYRVLLIDRNPIGSGQTSACGTIFSVLKYWGVSECVLETHDRLTLHTARRIIDFPSPYLWCTFDYRRLCETLYQRSGAAFLQASAKGMDGGLLQTNKGDFRAPLLVDASGWRAVLASSIHDSPRTPQMNFGIESIVPTSYNDVLTPSALHFWYDPAFLKGGVGWVFPRGDKASIGVGSYLGASPLRQPLNKFASLFSLETDGVHGTYFPNALRSTTAGNIFIVGDAAGMCIGLTSEGIRPAMFFGEACGKILRRVLTGEITREVGLAKYANFVNARRRFFQIFSALQVVLTRLPPPWIDFIALILKGDRVRPWMLDRYWALTRVWDNRKETYDGFPKN